MSTPFLIDLAGLAGVRSLLPENRPKVRSDLRREFIALLKAEPDKHTFGSSGIGGSSHIPVEMLMHMAGVRMTHVPFRGNGPSSAALLGIWHSERIEVTVSAYRARPGITVHTSHLPPDEVTVVEGIPVTCPSRTILDLATVIPSHQVERACNEVGVHGLTDTVSVPQLIERYPGRRGLRTIKSIMASGPAFTRGELEARFTAFRRKLRLPSPSLNAVVEGFECDCVWWNERLIVELDGRATHLTRAAFERDRHRDRILTTAGWQVVRVTWNQLHYERKLLEADLRKLLRPSPSRGPRRGPARAAGP